MQVWPPCRQRRRGQHRPRAPLRPRRRDCAERSAGAAAEQLGAGGSMVGCAERAGSGGSMSGAGGSIRVISARTGSGAGCGSKAGGRSVSPCSKDKGAGARPARTILVSTTTSDAPPIMIRCSTLSRRISTSCRCLSRSCVSTMPSRGWRVRPPDWPFILRRPPWICRTNSPSSTSSARITAEATTTFWAVERSKPNNVCKGGLMNDDDKLRADAISAQASTSWL